MSPNTTAAVLALTAQLMTAFQCSHPAEPSGAAEAAKWRLAAAAVVAADLR
jgi:hypothetical protein